MAVTGYPPHGSGCALLTHPAPTSGIWRRSVVSDRVHGGHTDNLSEQVCQQIGMLVTIASGIAGGLAGNSTASAGTGPWRVRTRLKTIC
ncbi:hypothetical protein FZN16_15325 [Escherichia coli]|nr:hypothetical protein [Escherichia coli]EFB6176260.1 hypothetical protein [Escherichia coli]EFE2076576.1 hypothetical protein [Escherichia coli]EFN5588709.1 hypothetical protein [Escherichia coli]EFN5872762.1 hypothetical protein [Escherichia coli]